MIKPLSKISTLALAILTLLYLLTRTINILSLPIFLDEALYLRMTRDLLSFGQIWISFVDGKEPFFFWVNAIFLRILPNPLFAGRLLQVLAGLGTLLVLYHLTNYLFKRKVALVASLLYIFSPFFLLYNRLAILDNFLTFILIAYVYFLLRTIRERSKKYAVLCGTFLGLALITKSLALMYLVAIPSALLVFGNIFRMKRRDFLPILLILAIAACLYFPLTQVPGFEAIAVKNATLTWPLKTAFSNLDSIFIINLKTVIRHWLPYLWGFVPMGLVALFSTLAVFRKNREIIFLIALLVIPTLAGTLIGRIFFPRHLLFTTVPFLIILAWAIVHLADNIKSKLLAFAVVLCLLIQPGISTLSLAYWNKPNFLPEIEKWQLYYGWPSGNCLLLPVEKIEKLAATELIKVSIPPDGVAEVMKLSFYDSRAVTLLPDANAKVADYQVFNYYQEDTALKPLTLDSKLCRQPPKIYELQKD